MLQLRNQFILAPVKLGYSDKSGVITEKHFNFYNLRSKHIGAVNLEPLFMNSGLRELPTQIGIDDDSKIEGLKKLSDLIHANSAKVIANINHAGRMTVKKLQSKNDEIFTNYKVIEVVGSKVIIESEEGTKELENIDKIVIAFGMKSYIPFEYKGDAPIYWVGDANKVGKAQEAIHDAYELAVNL